MIRLVSLFLLFITLGASGASDPYMVENKVKTDLESSLGRVLPREQFFVHVTTDVNVVTERRLIEGETVTKGPVESDDDEDDKPISQPQPLEMMPGFFPERSEITPPPKPPTPKRNEEQRNVFRLIDTPTLQLVRVHVGLDEDMKPELTDKIRSLVQTYLSGNYPNRSIVNFSRVPMIKPPPAPQIIEKVIEKLAEKPLEEKKDDPKRDLAKEKGPDEWIKEYLPWIGLVFMGLCLLFMAFILRGKDGKGLGGTFVNQIPQWPDLSRLGNQQPAWAGAGGSSVGGSAMGAARATMPNSENFPGKSEEEKIEDGTKTVINPLEKMRNRFLDAVMARSEAFKLYYQRLGQEARDEIYAALAGPAFDTFLEGLGFPIPQESVLEAADLDEKLEAHFKSFREFTISRDWQDRQFFGFLNRLTDEQLMTLVNHEPPIAVCTMLKFLKPNQGAFVLDSMTPERRTEVLAQVNRMNSISFSDVITIEKKVRESVEKLPAHFFGSPREDVAYWGQVLNESLDQDSILNDVEKTNPGIFPHLKKFKFKLDDVGSVPKPVLKKVLGECDNDELSLALLTVPEAVVAFVLSSVSAQRREFLVEQIASSRGAPKERLMEARLTLTKRFREALA